MTEQFKILSPRDHVRLKIGMYLGSTAVEEIEQFVLGKWFKARYVPALLKMINEILDNSIDEAIRSNFKFANKIEVYLNYDTDTITINDNGRGIPQEFVTEPSGEQIMRPVAAWTRVNAGTSFTSERITIGSHGVGSAATNFLSKSFIGKTWQIGTMIEVHCTNGAENILIKKKQKIGNGTSVSFVPDFTFFEVKSLIDLDTSCLVEDRLVSLQMAFPEIAFYFNGSRIQIRDIKRYSELYSPKNETVILEKNENLSFFFTSSSDGFRSNSYVNGVNTRLGGTYIDFIINSVLEELAILVKKKHKIEVTKSVLKNGLSFILFARNFTNPKFDSQTKERLTNSLGDVKTHYEKYCNRDFLYLAKRIFAADDIMQPILEAQLAKKNADEKREALLAQKKLKKVKVAKHIAANTPENGMLFLMEGLSALGYFLKVRNPLLAGAYPLRGVSMNVWDTKPTEVLKNKEFSELIAILGLDINDPQSYKTMTYKKVAIFTDADVDGSGHISPLLIAFFYRFWPDLFKDERIIIIRSPIMISFNGKTTKWFYTYEEAQTFKETNSGFENRYIKGLGSLQESEYNSIVNNPVFDVVSIDDSKYLDLMFGADSEPRKKFMME